MKTQFGEDSERSRFDRRMNWVGSLALLVIFAVMLVNGVRSHDSWENMARDLWIWPFLALGLMPVRWGVAVQIPILAAVLWVDIKDQPMTLSTLKHLPFLDWIILAVLGFFVFILVSWLFRKASYKRLPQV